MSSALIDDYLDGRAWTWPVPAAVRLGFGAVLDATAVAAAVLAAPALTVALGTAAGVSLGRIAFTAWTLPRLASR